MMNLLVLLVLKWYIFLHKYNYYIFVNNILTISVDLIILNEYIFLKEIVM